MRSVISLAVPSRRLVCFTALTVAFLFSSALFAEKAFAETIYFDGFESGDFSAWDFSGEDWVLVNSASGAHSGNYRAEGRGDSISTGSRLDLNVDTTGYDNLVLDFWYQIPDSGFEIGEDMNVSYTIDGMFWWELHTFLDGDETTEWTHFVMPLPEGSGDNPDFGIFFETNAHSASDIFKLDNVTVSGDVIVIDTDNDDDGVDDELDLCPDTVADDFSDFGKAKAHWQYNGSDWEGSGKGDPNYAVDMAYTHGCGGTQILQMLSAETGEDYAGAYKYGLSKGMIEDWLALLL